MGFFNLSRDEQARIDAMPGTSEVPAPGALEGLLTAIPKGIVSGADKVGQLGNDLASSDAGYAFFNSPSPDELIAHIQNPQPDSEAYKQAAAGVKVATDWAATGQDPRVTGTVGRIASGTSEGLTIGLGGAAVAGPWGAASLLGTAEGYSGYKEAKAQGVDETTAQEQGALTGVFAAGSAFLPMKFGKTLAQSVIGGSLANVTLGAAQRGLTSEVLESHGYHEMAGQYRIADGEAVASDLILGAAFGAFGHATARRVNPADVDAASAVAAEDHFNRSAPGIPTDPQTATLHADTMAGALHDLANGDLPDIPADRAQQLVDKVVPDPAHEPMADLHEAAQAELPGFESAAADLKPVEMPAEQPAPSVGNGRIDQAFQSMAAGIGQNFVDGFYDTLTGGPKRSSAFKGERLYNAAKQALDAGQIKSPDDLRRFLEQDLAKPNEPKATGEPAKPVDVPLDPYHQDQLDHLVHNYGDLPYQLDDGREVSFRQVAEEMQKQRNEADTFAKLHDVAAACAARNGV